MTTFLLTIQANDQDAIRRLRWLLKSLARQYGLTCIDAQEIPHELENLPNTQHSHGSPLAPR